MESKTIRSNLGIIILTLIYLVVNIWFLVQHPGSIFNQPERFGEAISLYGSRDASLYAKMAWQIINDGIYGYNADHSNAYVTPGQPFYLVLIFKLAEVLNTNHVMLTRLANMLLNLGIVILIYKSALMLFNREAISILSSLLYCLHIAPLHYFRTTLTEIPAIFLFLLSFFLFLLAREHKKYRLHILFGIVASITLMFRATPAPLLLLAWGIILKETGFKEGVKIGFIWCIGPLLIMAPWVIRNVALFNQMYLFSSHAGDPLLAGTNAFYMKEHAELLLEANERGLTSEEYGQIRMIDGFKGNFPLFFSWYTIGKLVWLFMDTSGNPEGLGPYSQEFSNVVLHFFRWQNALTVLIAFISIIVCRHNRNFIFLSFMIIIYIGISNIFLTIPRYGFFIYPFICIIAAFGLVKGWNIVIFRRLKKESG